MKQWKNSKRNQCLLILLLFVLGAGCAEEEQNLDSPEERETARPEWDWDNFAVSENLSMGDVPLEVRPRRSVNLRSEKSGTLTVEVDERVSEVSAGDVFARMDVEALDEQTERLAIREKRFRLEREKEENLEQPERERAALEALEEARRDFALLEIMLANPGLEEIASSLFDRDVSNLTEQALANARRELTLIEREFEWAQENEPVLREGSIRLQEMDMDRSRRQLEESIDQSIFDVPFDGELRLEVEWIEGQRDYSVSSREVVAILNDYTDIHAVISVDRAPWVDLDPSRLELRLTGRTPSTFTYYEDRYERDDRGQRGDRLYVFRVPLVDHEGLKRLVGAQMEGQLVYQLPEKALLVPKFDLALYSLNRTQTTDWNMMVSQLWPEAELLAVGENELAIVPPGGLEQTDD
ncbi:MAG: hypothetical protein JJT75_04540 [Opitutales bacterium]|nr:hypothetical protein [Opitutales bacterium]MCH8541348.1 hypothetical protein [Opitutales bacterium]